MATEETQATERKPYRMNALTGIGVLALIVGFLPVVGGDGTMAPFPTLIGVLLVIGGVLQHVIQNRN